MTDVWTAQGSLGDDHEGWILGGVFSTFENACEFAEVWASERRGVQVHVFRRALDHTWNEIDSYEGDTVPVFEMPPTEGDE